MDVNFGHLPNQEHFILRSLIFDKDSIDHYLDDPNLSVLDMIKQVKKYIYIILFF
jgi:hypothetical protein